GCEPVLVLVSGRSGGPLASDSQCESGPRSTSSQKVGLRRIADQRLVVVGSELWCNPVLQLDDLKLGLLLLLAGLGGLCRLWFAGFHGKPPFGVKTGLC